MDLGNLDLKAVEKEMEAEEAAIEDTVDERASDSGDDQAT